MPQLDGLRAIAVIGVMLTHFGPFDSILSEYLNLGSMGVRLFFVLSGYLIGGILLDAKLAIGDDQSQQRSCLLSFYARRAIRLIPVYYLYLLLSYLFLPGASEYIVWFLTYTQNFLFAANPEVYSKIMAHFWTLAVEEQFYIVIPAILIFLPVNAISSLRYLLPFAFLFAISFRVLGDFFGFSEFQTRMMMPSHIDALGAGVWLAFMQTEHRATVASRWSIWFTAVLGTILIFAATILWEYGQRTVLQSSLGLSGQVLLFIWIIHRASIGFVNPVGWILGLLPLVYLGRISYGVYVLHFNVPGLLRDRLFPKLGLNFPNESFSKFALCASISILLATLSWYFLEKPLLSLKKSFPYLRS